MARVEPLPYNSVSLDLWLLLTARVEPLPYISVSLDLWLLLTARAKPLPYNSVSFDLWLLLTARAMPLPYNSVSLGLWLLLTARAMPLPYVVIPNATRNQTHYNFFKYFTSAAVKWRYLPFGKSPNCKSPVATRFNCATGWAMASHILRTCRFLPS